MPLEEWDDTIYDEDVPLNLFDNINYFRTSASILYKRDELKKAITEFPKAIPTSGYFMFPADALQGKMNRLRRRNDLMNYRYRAILGPTKYFSTILLRDLRMVNLSDMSSLNKRYIGTYFFCRIISKPHRKLSITFAVEDRIGETEQITAYNLFGNIPTGEELDSLLPFGMILAIREPYRKIPMGGEGSVIRVDSPSDIIFLHHTSPVIAKAKFSTLYNQSSPTSIDTDFKLLGNNLFKEKKYWQAVMQYSEGITVTSLSIKQSEIVLRLNRAACHLALKNFTSAYFDTVTSLELLNSSSSNLSESSVDELKHKGMFRQAVALEGMRFYPEAGVRFVEYLETRPKDVEAKAGKKRIEQRLKESTTGKYNWFSMWEKSCTSTEDQADVADFFGPIKVTKLSKMGGGRGIVATRDIHCGELLLVEKAFALEKPSKNLPQVMSIDIEQGILDMTATPALITNVVTKVVEDPSLVQLLDGLYGGTRYPAKTIPEIGARRELPVYSRFPQSIDVRRIEDVLSMNCYGSSAIDKDGAGGIELSTTSSLFNHSCLPNGVNLNYTNILVIRARCPIKKDEQIFLSYTGISGDDLETSISEHKDREHYMLKYLGNSEGCECECCRMDRLEGKEKRLKRDKLLEGIKGGNQLVDTTEIEALRDTFSPLRVEYRPKLYKPLMKYAEWYLLNTKKLSVITSSITDKDLKEYIKIILEAVSSTGAQILFIPIILRNNLLDYGYKVIKLPLTHINLPVWSCLICATRLQTWGKDDESSKWFDVAIEIEILARDLGMNFFLEEYTAYLPTEKSITFIRDAFARSKSSRV